MKSSVYFFFIYCNPHDHPPNLTLLLSPMQFHSLSLFFFTSGFNVGTEKKNELELFKAQQSRLTDCKNTQNSIMQLGVLIGLYHQ